MFNFYRNPVSIKTKKAFTLIEVMIASVILVGFLYGVYELFMSFRRVNDRGMWVSKTTNEVRNGLNLLRQEISKATVPTTITQTGGDSSLYTSDSKLFFSGSPVTITDFSADAHLLKFFMGVPGRQGIVGEPDIPTTIMQGLLEIQGGQVIYTRSFVSGDSTKIPEISQIIARNPGKIDLEIVQITDQNLLAVNLRNFVKLTIESVAPKFPETKVTESIEAPFEVVPQQGGSL
ncbi:MAG: prepilin-type N-terminal cleavage/methylation domain-containing protein [Candidatus Riflebacteria bacterium]|nr:prepilin-type N-terminal cleavage/methylation domain-containing protein [Candidatus Riflebacteria bacterium]